MSMEIVVGIATHGRPAILAETLAFLAQQQRPPDRIFVVYAEAADVGKCPQRFPQATFVAAKLGLTRQRNIVVDLAQGCDYLQFFDDDFYPHPTYLRLVEKYLEDNPEVVAITGRVLADDVKGPGLTVAQAKAIIAGSHHAYDEHHACPTFLAYGCNMGLRMQTIREHGLRFDEHLPLYGWYEDWDFTARIGRFGAVMHMSNACGVHLSTKSGRITGVRMGYAQVANPIYLARKGTFLWSSVFAFIAGPFFKNLVRSIAPESHVDRRGRFYGNLAAFRDLVTGRLSPTQITNL
jgi:GT2 family glycosyltransferase